MGRPLLPARVEEASEVCPLVELAHPIGVDGAGEFEMEHGPGPSSGGDPSDRVVVSVSCPEFMSELVIYQAGS
jgi:hypothetical protein